MYFRYNPDNLFNFEVKKIIPQEGELNPHYLASEDGLRRTDENLLSAKDRRLFKEIAIAEDERRKQQPYPPVTVDGITFRNAIIGKLAEGISTISGFSILSNALTSFGTLHIPTTTITDGPIKRLVGATENGSGEMVHAFWIRDQALIASHYLKSGGVDFSRTGIEILVSLHSLMSTPAQLGRFHDIINNYDNPDYVADPYKHPHIFMGKSNLETKEVEQWSHKQDAWQMLVYNTFELLRNNSFSCNELSSEQKHFLGVVIPYLYAIKFWEASDSGSWEEIEARRASTLSWNIKVVDSIRQFADKKDFKFLQDYFNDEKKTLHIDKNLTLKAFCDQLVDKAIPNLSRMIPYESSVGYNKDDPRYREADAALIYLLMLRIPKLLSEEKQLTGDSKKEYISKKEYEILKTVATLVDPVTHGIKRYAGDSYQAGNYWTNRVQDALKLRYEHRVASDPSGIKDFTQRNKLVNVKPGEEASWTMFNFQLSSWAGEKSIERPEYGQIYYRLQRYFLLSGLAMITTEKEYSVVNTADGCMVMKVPAFRIPECLVRNFNEGREFIFPGPFTPLNWATGELINALNVWEKTSIIIQRN